jgi:Fe-S cluster assembly scaffold protein SufB
MYSSKVSDQSSVVVNGRGFSRSGRIVFRGVMDAKKGAKNAGVSEHFECLFLDDESSFEAIPSLFVSENELSAEHGATAYKIPYDEVFYMMSRGFSREEVSLIVAKGVLDGFDELQNWVGKALRGVSG